MDGRRNMSQVVVDDEFDALAEAFLFLTPILYAKLIDWMNGSPPAGLTHERISKAWAK